MFRETGHEKLLSILGAEGVLPLGEIAKRLGVGEATARHGLTAPGRAGGSPGSTAARWPPPARTRSGPFSEVAVDDLASREVVLPTAAGKFPGDTGLARICGPQQIDTLITNKTSDPATLEVFREAGVEVVTV